jgi:hypothetical protein
MLTIALTTSGVGTFTPGEVQHQAFVMFLTRHIPTTQSAPSARRSFINLKVRRNPYRAGCSRRQCPNLRS